MSKKEVAAHNKITKALNEKLAETRRYDSDDSYDPNWSLEAALREYG